MSNRHEPYEPEHSRSKRARVVEWNMCSCACGCGLPAPIAKENRANRGIVKGQPRPYRRGHHWRRDPAVRFWEKVSKSDGCWEWQATRDQKGYGRIRIGGDTRAHRIAWILTNGPIPDGLQVCHHCDNPPCVRPDHLFLGTSHENTLDAVWKGRFEGRGHPTAEDMSHAVGPEVAACVRQLRDAGWAQHRIARTFGISRRSVQRILDGDHWTARAA